jgi:hypothetical protein
MRRQYVLIEQGRGIVGLTRNVTEIGLQRICTRRSVAGYQIGYELNHEAFPPEYEGDCYYRLDLVAAVDGVNMTDLTSIRRESLIALGYKGL